MTALELYDLLDDLHNQVSDDERLKEVPVRARFEGENHTASVEQVYYDRITGNLVIELGSF